MKIGRNDRCPCGSGRKLKHCCLVAPNSGSIRNFVPASPAASSAFSASLGVQWALDDLRTLTLWFGAQPVEALDESKRGALGILAGDLLGAI